MNSSIFLVKGDGGLVEMRETFYDSEALLQSLLERYPSLLAGDQVNPRSPRRWLLVRREAPVPSELDGRGRWSLDHLFSTTDRAQKLLDWARGIGAQPRCARENVIATVKIGPQEVDLFRVDRRGKVTLVFPSYEKCPPFDRAEMLRTLRDRFAAIDPAMPFDKSYPVIDLHLLSRGTKSDELIGVFDWLVAQARDERKPV